MAANLLSIRPVGVRACATTGHRKPDANRRKSSSPSSASPSWWTPLFGWSSEPDYIDSESNGNNKQPDLSVKADGNSGVQKPARSKFAPGGFTEEKARQLRMMTTESFHDVMYHSAIASRLASDFSNRSDL